MTCLTALVSPFNGEELDEEGFRKNLHFQKEGGVDGVVVLGTTGEAPTLSKEEKRRLISIAAEAKGNLALMVGTGSYSTQETIRNTRVAADLGAESALVICPYYNKPTQEGLFAHFAAVAKASPIPILLYNHPGRTGVSLALETIQRLQEFPRIVGIKECSGDLSLMKEIIATRREGFSVLSGDDARTVEMMALGGEGVISVLANAFPAEMKQLVETQVVSEGLDTLFELTNVETNPVPIKEMMEMRGLAAGPPRLPLVPLREESRALLQKEMSRWASALVS